MKFIIPRLLGLAIIAGVASLILGMIFKLLIGIVAISSVVVTIGNIIRKQKLRNNGMFGMERPQSQLGFRPPFNNGYFNQPVSITGTQAEIGIIPIN